MGNSLTAGGLYAVARLLSAESLASKKARLFAATQMERLAGRHAQRFAALLALLAE